MKHKLHAELDAFSCSMNIFYRRRDHVCGRIWRKCAYVHFPLRVEVLRIQECGFRCTGKRLDHFRSLLLPLMMYAVVTRLKMRMERLGTEPELKLIFTDTCCEGLAEPKNHVVAKLFTGVTRAPYADNYHKTQILTTSTRTSHALHASYSK